MKFIRNARIRERVLDLASKALLIAFSALVCLWMISGARAADITGIQQGPNGEGEYAIQFAFSTSVPKENVAVEFQRNFIQVSLRGVSAYPARTERLSHPLLEKVFTYQYQPDLARARVLLKVPASEIQSKATWEVIPQGLKVIVRGAGNPVAKAAAPKVEKIKAEAKDSVKTKSAGTTIAAASNASSASAAAAASSISEDSTENQAIQQILEDSKKPNANADASVGAASPVAVKAPEDQPIFNASNSSVLGTKGKEPAAGRIFTSLLLVMGVIAAIALGYRRFVLGRGISFGNMSFQRQNRMIETIASQSLGPKRSVALIRVLDQHMVVGMSGESMTLLANLGTNVNLDKYNEEAGSGASFADTFQGAIGGGDNFENTSATQKSSVNVNMRSAIKKRMEGFKPLRG